MKASPQFKEALRAEMKRQMGRRVTEQANPASLQRDISRVADLSRSLTKELHNLSVQASRLGAQGLSDTLGEANRAAVGAHKIVNQAVNEARSL